jgi:hypothetical protein
LTLPPPHLAFAPPPRHTPHGGSLLPAPVGPRVLTLPGVGARRAGPPGLLVAAILLAAVVGGAKLASLATKDDTARLQPAAEADEPAAPSKGAAPAPGSPAPSPAPR